jgi:hypothetical protein
MRFSRTHLAAWCGETTGKALTSNAAQVAGLGRIYFGLLCSRIFTESTRIREKIITRYRCSDLSPAESNFLIIRFPFAILEEPFLAESKMVADVFAAEQLCDRKKSVWSMFSEDVARRPQVVGS